MERELMDLNPGEAKLKARMAEACQQVVGVFHSSKWWRTGRLSFVTADRIHAIVTDAKAPPELVQQWRDRGVEVVTAKAELHAQPAVRAHRLRRLVPPPQVVA